MPLPLLAALAAGSGAAAAGGIALDALTSHSANQAMIEQANANRAFARNAHQIEVADLLKAGLSPLLSYRGQGASISGGAAPDIKPVTARTAETMQNMLTAGKQRDLIDAQTQLATASAAKANEETRYIEWQRTGKGPTEVQEIGSRIPGHLASARLTDQQTENLRATLPKIQMEIKAIGAATDKQLQELKTEQFSTDIRELDYYERVNIVPQLIAMIAREREKMDMSMPGAENRMTAQMSAFQRLMAALGFAQSETSNIVERAMAITTLRPK